MNVTTTHQYSNSYKSILYYIFNFILIVFPNTLWGWRSIHYKCYILPFPYFSSFLPTNNNKWESSTHTVDESWTRILIYCSDATPIYFRWYLKIYVYVWRGNVMLVTTLPLVHVIIIIRVLTYLYLLTTFCI